ncbi:MAG: TasA family protein [Agathobacter sp.]|nr:TasA family protein [Agathobacter sp.]
MKRKISLSIAAMAMVLTIAIGGTLAYFTDHDSATNVITMGKVKISLVEKTVSTGEKEYTDGISYDGIHPGDVISKQPIVKVAADSQPAYIRVRVHAKSPDAELAKHLSELSYDVHGWKYINGYYYYPHIVYPGTSITLFQHVTIPTGWGNFISGKTFKIDLTAEAIQASYFNPDFNSGADPWHGVMIE